MAANCGICLEPLTRPVSIPCGHVHCAKCITNHISSGADLIKSSCPVCRASFHTVLPDTAYVPVKYHQYLLPAVRRLYLDTSLHTDLKNRIAKLEAQVRSLEKDKDKLVDKCESHMAASEFHAEEERTARLELEQKKELVERTLVKYNVLDTKYHDLLNQNAQLSAAALDLQKKSKKAFQAFEVSFELGQKRSASCLLPSNDEGDPPLSRPVRPSRFNLLKRPRYSDTQLLFTDA